MDCPHKQALHYEPPLPLWSFHIPRMNPLSNYNILPPILSPRRDYANRKIEDIKKNRQRLAKLTEPQRQKNKVFFLGKAQAPNLHLKRLKEISLSNSMKSIISRLQEMAHCK